MVSTLVYFTILIICIFYLPTEMMIIAGFYLSIVFLLYSLYRKRDVTLYLIFIPVNLIIIFSYYVIKWVDFLPYTGSIFYSILALNMLVSFITGRQLLTPKRDVTTAEMLRARVSYAIGLLFQLTALVLSVVLFPNVLYIVLPIVISILPMFVHNRLTDFVMNTFFTEKKTA